MVVQHIDDKDLSQKAIDSICQIIRSYNVSIKTNLEQIVANLCDVDVNEMMNDTKHQHNLHARWLFWYAYRYMTNDSFISMSKTTASERQFTIQCICAAINKMSTLITHGTIWTKRWVILKRIIKEHLAQQPKQEEIFENEVTIKVTAPKGVNVELKQE